MNLLLSFTCVLVLLHLKGTAGWFGKKPANKKCLFEPCKDYCRNGGSCTRDDSTCSPLKCDCPSGFTGRRCEEVLDDGADQPSSDGCPLRPLEDRLCFPFPCVHGHCNNTDGERRCICDRHWTGDRCSKLDCSSCGRGVSCRQTSCDDLVCDSPTTTQEDTKPTTPSPEDLALRPLDERLCAPTFECIHGTCRNTGISCVCDEGYAGLFCSERIASTTLKTKTYTDDVCAEEYSLRPLSERQCMESLTCKYGLCVEMAAAGSPARVTYSCGCDQHASGQQCEHRCCRDCGLFGECVVSDGRELCECQYGVMGKFCNETIEDGGAEEQRLERPSNWRAWMFGILALVLVILLVTVVVIPYLLWRRGSVLMMKIVHFFQPVEQNDEMLYDALVVYHGGSEQATKIAADILLPYLHHQCGFSVKLQGQQTATEDDINRSRRLVVLISSDFILHKWPLFSAKISEDNFSSLRKRIVPVFLEKARTLCTGADKRLEDLVSKSVFITWSDQEMEKLENLTRIKYSLPKKRFQPDERKLDNPNLEKRQVDICNVSHSSGVSNDKENDEEIHVISKNKLDALGTVDFNHNPYNMPYFKGK